MTVCEFKKLTVGDEVFVDGMLAIVTDVSDDDNIRSVSVSYFDDHACIRREECMLVELTRDENHSSNFKVFSRLTAYHSIYDVGGV